MNSFKFILIQITKDSLKHFVDIEIFTIFRDCWKITEFHFVLLKSNIFHIEATNCQVKWVNNFALRKEEIFATNFNFIFLILFSVTSSR